MKLQKMGALVVETFQNPPVPYKLWGADIYKCPACGVEIVGAFSAKPIMEHFEPGVEEYIAGRKAIGCPVVYSHEHIQKE